jgi:hypothetical protein
LEAGKYVHIFRFDIMKKYFWPILIVFLAIFAILMNVQAQSNIPTYCYRVVDDEAAFGEIREFSSAFTGTWYPAVFPFTTSPKSGDAAYKINVPWYQYTVADAPDILRWMGGGWLNTSQNKGFGWKAGEYVPKDWSGSPLLKAEALTTTGNLVCGNEIVNGSLKITHYSLNNSPQGDYFHQPWLWIKGTSLNKNTGALGLWDGKNVYFPNLAAGDIYLDLDYLESVPTLPKTIYALTNLNIREYPTVKAAVIDTLIANEAVRIIGYHYWGSDVWGELDSGGWICLVYSQSWGAYYYTTWNMETDPPLNSYPRTEQPLSDFTGQVVSTYTITPTNSPEATETPPEATKTPISGGDYENGYFDGWNDCLDMLIPTMEAMRK